MVSVDIVIVDEADRSSSVQITLHDVPGPLADVQVRPAGVAEATGAANTSHTGGS